MRKKMTFLVDFAPVGKPTTELMPAIVAGQFRLVDWFQVITRDGRTLLIPVVRDDVQLHDCCRERLAFDIEVDGSRVQFTQDLPALNPDQAVKLAVRISTATLKREWLRVLCSKSQSMTADDAQQLELACIVISSYAGNGWKLTGGLSPVQRLENWRAERRRKAEIAAAK